MRRFARGPGLPALEIILVDNRPEPIIPVPEWLSDLPDVRLLHERQPGISAARNRGIDAAEGSIVAFTDDDVIVDPGWLGPSPPVWKPTPTRWR